MSRTSQGRKSLPIAVGSSDSWAGCHLRSHKVKGKIPNLSPTQFPGLSMNLWISSGQFVTFHSYFCNSEVSILPKLFIKKYLIHQLRWRSDCILTGHPGERPGGKAFALEFLFSWNPNCRRLDSSRPVLFHLGSKIKSHY